MSIDPARWRRIQDLFHDALALPEPERGAFLSAASPDDPAIAAEVQTLLEADARSGSLLERGVDRLAHDVLDGSVPHLERVGVYRVLGVIGHGGMGVVYLGERADLSSRAAIKVLRDAWLSPARRERFASEQRTLAQLSHPGIARLYDADSLPDGTPYFVMEYVPGVPLTEYCAAHDSSIAERLRLFCAVCDAVQYAHGHAVVHRDVKPSNILVTDDGGIKLLDFGIAKHLETLDTAAHQTQVGLRAMTPAYAAPEQIRGEPVGTYTDVYALGVVLYELLTDRRPFDALGLTPGQVESAIFDRDPAQPSQVARLTGGSTAERANALTRGKWADLDVLCATALRRDPQQRYRTVEALMRDIAHFLRDEPLEARPPTLGYTLSRFVRRHARTAAAGAAAVLVIVSLVGFYTVRLARARDAALLESARTQRIQAFVLDLFAGGDPAAGPADSLRVVTLIDRGVLTARALSAEPSIQSELYHTLGGIYQQLGNLSQADTLLAAALQQRRNVFGADHPEVARSLVALGLLRAEQARMDEAEQLAREGLDRTRRHFPADHPAVRRAVTALGTVLQSRGSYDASIAVLDEAVRFEADRGANDIDYYNALRQLANTYFYAGKYPASDSLNRRLLATTRELYGEQHPYNADALVNLGAVQVQLGNYAQAESYLRRALEIHQAFYGRDHGVTAGTMNMLGQSLVYQNRHAEAIDMLRQALAVRERVYGPAHPRVASSLNELGNTASVQGDFAAARAYFTRMLAIYQQVYGGQHYLMGIAQSNLGSVELRAGHPERAEPILREAISVFTRTLPAEHVNIAIARIKLGRALVRQARYADAEREILAGYDILVKQTNPAVSFLRAAREDLIIVYDALKQADKAARYRAELEQAAATG